MKKETTKKTFRMNGWIYTYNEPMTSNWGWPEGRKGERVRILKKQMLQLLKERDAFSTPYENIEEATQEAPSAPTEGDFEPNEEQEGVQQENAPEATEKAEDTTEQEPTEVTVSLPIESHTEKSVINLVNLVYTRAGLINKALGTQFFVDDELVNGGAILILPDDVEGLIAGKKNNLFRGIEFADGKIFFSASLKNSDPETLRAFMELVAAMNKQALTQKRIQAKKVNDENEKYAMRIWLTRLGMNGPEYKEVRRTLMRNLSGHSAFRTEEEKQRWMDRHAAKEA